MGGGGESHLVNSKSTFLIEFQSKTGERGEVTAQLPLDTCYDLRCVGGSRGGIENWCQNAHWSINSLHLMVPGLIFRDLDEFFECRVVHEFPCH